MQHIRVDEQHACSEALGVVIAKSLVNGMSLVTEHVGQMFFLLLTNSNCAIQRLCQRLCPTQQSTAHCDGISLKPE